MSNFNLKINKKSSMGGAVGTVFGGRRDGSDVQARKNNNSLKACFLFSSWFPVSINDLTILSPLFFSKIIKRRYYPWHFLDFFLPTIYFNIFFFGWIIDITFNHPVIFGYNCSPIWKIYVFFKNLVEVIYFRYKYYLVFSENKNYKRKN